MRIVVVNGCVHTSKMEVLVCIVPGFGSFFDLREDDMVGKQTHSYLESSVY